MLDADFGSVLLLTWPLVTGAGLCTGLDPALMAEEGVVVEDVEEEEEVIPVLFATAGVTGAVLLLVARS